MLFVDSVKQILEFVEEFEGGFAHDVEHMLFGVLWRYFESA